MIDDLLQDRAASYVAGTMTSQEREQFELVLEFHTELRAFVTPLLEVGMALASSATPMTGGMPSHSLKSRIVGMVAGKSQRLEEDPLVMAGTDGLVQWVNPAFSAMCGYSFDELKGKKLGPILQGEKTDLQAAERMRNAVREYRPCRETILNYHKNGTPYWVDVAITPILDDEGAPLWLVAREVEVAGTAA